MRPVLRDQKERGNGQEPEQHHPTRCPQPATRWRCVFMRHISLSIYPAKLAGNCGAHACVLTHACTHEHLAERQCHSGILSWRHEPQATLPPRISASL